MNIEYKNIKDIKPYEKNPRKNDEAVKFVAKSIEDFGFRVPIIIDKNNIIVCGHTRYKAAKSLGMKKVPCIMADDLTDEQVKAFRLADNKVSEFAYWDMDLLDEELAGIGDFNMLDLGFCFLDDEEQKGGQNVNDWFNRKEFDGRARQDGNDEYNAFLDKQEIPKTTDDCYTPADVYDVIADYVAERYNVKRENFARPFYPGGDYENEKYDKDCIVVDNPPFSMLANIIDFFIERNIKFFLFAPALVCFRYLNRDISAIITGQNIIYENGASVPTAFLTNMETEFKVLTAPVLYNNIKSAESQSKNTANLPTYKYDEHVATVSNFSYFAKNGINFGLCNKDCLKVPALDAQKEFKKLVYGDGFLISDAKAKEKEAKEKEAKEKEAKEKAFVFELSDREKEIVKRLG